MKIYTHHIHEQHSDISIYIYIIIYMSYTLSILIIIFSILIQTLQQYAFLLLHACDMTCVTTHASRFYILKIYLVKHTLPSSLYIHH